MHGEYWCDLQQTFYLQDAEDSTAVRGVPHSLQDLNKGAIYSPAALTQRFKLSVKG